MNNKAFIGFNDIFKPSKQRQVWFDNDGTK
jgi:hypothetical protein